MREYVSEKANFNFKTLAVNAITKNSLAGYANEGVLVKLFHTQGKVNFTNDIWHTEIFLSRSLNL